MAVIGFEGFDELYAGGINANATNDLISGVGSPWSVSSTLNAQTPAGQWGGKALQFGSGGNLYFTPGGNLTTFVVGFRFFFGALPAAVNDMIRFNDGASVQCGLAKDASHRLMFWRGTNATVKGTGTTVLGSGIWYYVEVKVTFSTSATNTDGSFEVRLGGVAEIGPTSSVNVTTTANNYANNLMFYSPGMAMGIDDFYAEDTNFLGIQRVETLFPSANSTPLNFTPLASTNASQVDELTTDDDTTYNYSSVANDIDLFSHGALSSTPLAINGARLTVRARKDDVTANNIRTKLKSGTTTSDGSSAALITAYQRNRSGLYLTDPDTGIGWTESGINNSLIGYEHV